jgi:hypothetical protein
VQEESDDMIGDGETILQALAEYYVTASFKFFNQSFPETWLLVASYKGNRNAVDG